MAVKYLAGAYRAANGDHDRAVHYYAGGYYYAAKRQRLSTWQASRAGARRSAGHAMAPGSAQRRRKPFLAAHVGANRPTRALTPRRYRPTLGLFRGELR